MRPRSNADTEQCWIDAWSALDALTRGVPGCEIVLPEGASVTVEGCQAWLQSSAYQGCCVALRRYRRRDGRHRVCAQRWPYGDPEPAWSAKTDDGYVLDE
ncbi:MAG: hypothetical protein IT374_27575 [Polyangiaceae bacterium]|nr:hypothetical protein [Polyangiaceae bacterium]